LASLRLFEIRPDDFSLKSKIHVNYESAISNLLIKDQSIFFHVGFKRPDNEIILSLFRKYPNKTILSSAARSVFSEIDPSIHFSREFFDENIIFYLIGEEDSLTSNQPNQEISSEFASLSVRTRNALQRNGFHRVKQIIEYVEKNDLDSLKRFDGLGASSIDELVKFINPNSEVKKKNFNAKVISNESFVDFKKSVFSFFDDERMIDIVKKRLGLQGKISTLEEIAKSHKVTRERIRQIESKIKKIIFNNSGNISLFTDKRISDLRYRLNKPITISNLSIQDEWFKGVDTMEILNGLLTINHEPKNSLNRFENQIFISHLGKNSFKESIDYILGKIFKNKIEKENEIKDLISLHIPSTAFELRPWLFQFIISTYFSRNENEKMILTIPGTKKTKKNIFLGIFRNSDTPLNKNEILKIYKAGRPDATLRIVESGIEHLKDNEIFLFAPSTYGLRKHLQLTDEEIKLISTKTTELIKEENPNKQWSSSELLNKLKNKIDLNIFEKLDKFRLSIALNITGELTTLGKGSFGLKGINSISDKKIDKTEMIVDILDNSDTPLFTEEIKAKIEIIAPIAGNFQVHDRGRVLGVKKKAKISKRSGVIYRVSYGLIDKHFNINPKFHLEVIEEVIKEFSERDKINFEELKEEIFFNKILRRFYENVYLLISLCNRSVNFIVDDQYLYLTKNYSLEPKSQSDAIKIAAINVSVGGINHQDLFKKAEELYGSRLSEANVRRFLSKMEFVFHKDDNKWYRDNKIKYD